jgi:hypothetical protein
VTPSAGSAEHRSRPPMPPGPASAASAAPAYRACRPACSTPSCAARSTTMSALCTLGLGPVPGGRRTRRTARHGLSGRGRLLL